MSQTGLYLGGVLEQGEVVAPYHLPPASLRTHGVIVGMTGSGKTALSLVLLEELVSAGVPVIAIDPKGDLGNLGLLFPSLSAEDFAPWLDQPAQAPQLAQRWRQGLEEWGLSGRDVAALAEQLDLRVYTPGAAGGRAIDVLGAFRRPSAAEAADADGLRALVEATVSGLLGLVDRPIDPVKDPAHIVLSRILHEAWERGEDPDLEHLILKLVDPPFARVGVFPLDRFFPSDDRMALAMSLNGVLASPSFAPWTQGEAMDVASWLRPGQGRVPVHVICLSHLAEGQRQFFLSLLLGRLQAWSRAQPGTEQLRALLFFDEVAGYIPPHPARPPTKDPLLTMMKQARAVGLGVVLATQNPVDLDYKALSNAGTWLVGRLQTRQDRARLLDGIGRPDLDDELEALPPRAFLVHRPDGQTIMRSRQARCYLRGPLTRADIARLPGQAAPSPAPRAAAPAPASAAAPVAPPAAPPAASRASRAIADDLLPAPPAPPGRQWFLDPRAVFSAALAPHFESQAEAARPDGRMVWRPALYADLELLFDEERVGFELLHHERRVWFPLAGDLPRSPARVELGDQDLLDAPPPGEHRYAPLPTWVDEKRELDNLSRRVTEDVLRTESRGMWTHASLKLYGRGGEEREAFELRVREAIEERIAAETAKLAQKFQQEAERIEEKIRKQQEKVGDLKRSAQHRQVEEALNIGETVWAWFNGRSRSVSSAVSKRRHSSAASDQVERAESELGTLEKQAYELEQRLEEETARIRQKEEAALGQIKEQTVRLERQDIRLLAFGLLWVPVSRRI